MTTFAVTCPGHSGTKFLATILGRAEGWTVLHEPEPTYSFRATNDRFRGKVRYGEVNSWLLHGFNRVEADVKALLLRNPYDVCRSIGRSNKTRDPVLYVRECVALMDSMIELGMPFFLFRRLTADPGHLAVCARQLGVDLLPADADCRLRLNHHGGVPRSLQFDVATQMEFDDFMERHGI